MLNQFMVAQVQTSQQLRDQVTQVVKPPIRGSKGRGSTGHPIIHIPKITYDDDPEAFLNVFEWSAHVVGRPKKQWAVIW